MQHCVNEAPIKTFKKNKNKKTTLAAVCREESPRGKSGIRGQLKANAMFKQDE